MSLWLVGACAAEASAPGSPAAQGSQTAQSSDGAGAAAGPRAVQLQKVSRTQMPRVVGVSGTLAADERVTVSTKVPGRVHALEIDLGSVVSEGQVIATLEPTDYRLNVQQAQSGVAQARAQLGLVQAGDSRVEIEQTSLVKQAQATYDEVEQRLARARTLAERKLIAQAELDTLQAEFARANSSLDSAREQIRTRKATLQQRLAELASARQQLTDTVLRSPLDGTVEERATSVGAFLPAGTPVATIVRTDPLRLRVEVPERDASAVRVGQAVRVRLEGDQTQHLGRVARLSPTLRTDTRTLTVEAELPNEQAQLRAGSFARAEILVQESTSVLAVPTAAVVTFAGVEKVLTIEEGKAVEKVITTGRRNEAWIEVLSGVGEGEAVIVDPGNLQQGQAVRVSAP